MRGGRVLVRNESQFAGMSPKQALAKDQHGQKRRARCM